MKKRYKILLAIIVVLIAFRIYLPTLVKNYVNKTLSELDGYTGSITDVDLHLYRGAYKIDSLYIYSTEQDLEKPFFAANAIDLSVHWKDLFKGSIVGEVNFFEPQVNFQTTQSADSVVAGEDVDWTESIKDLIPIRINLFTIENGSISYLDPYADPPVDVYLHDLDFRLENIRNVEDQDDPLPSPFRMSATSLGEGRLTMDGRANLLKQMPDFDLNLEFENADLTAFNDFFKAYAWFDFEQGNFSLYTEMALVDGSIDGYFKPVMTDLKVIDWRDEEEGFLNKVYQTIVGGVTEVFENQPKDQTATEVPIEGTVESTEVGVVPAIVEVLKNAFIQPLRKSLEERVMVRGKDIIVESDKKE